MSKKKNEQLKIQHSQPPSTLSGYCSVSLGKKIKNLQNLKSYQIPNIKLKQHKKEQYRPQDLNQQQKISIYKIKSQRPSCSYDQQQLRIKTAPDQLFYQSNHMQTLSKKTPKSANNKSMQTKPTAKNSKDLLKKQIDINQRNAKNPKKKSLGIKNNVIKMQKNKKVSQTNIGFKSSLKICKTEPIDNFEPKCRLNKKHIQSLFIEQKLIKILINQSEQSSHSSRTARINEKNSQYLKLYNIKNYLNSIDMRMITKIRQDSLQLKGCGSEYLINQQVQNIIQYFQQFKGRDLEQLTQAAIKIQKFWRRASKKKIMSEYRDIFQNLINLENQSIQQFHEVPIQGPRAIQQKQNLEDSLQIAEQKYNYQIKHTQQQQQPLIKLIQIPNAVEQCPLQSSSYQSSVEGSQLQFYNQYIDFQCLSERRVCPAPEFVPSSSPQSGLDAQVFMCKSDRSNNDKLVLDTDSKYEQIQMAQTNQFVEYSDISKSRFQIVNRQIIGNDYYKSVDNVDVPIGDKIHQSYCIQIQSEQLSQLRQQLKINIQSAHKNKNKKSNWVNHPFFNETQMSIKQNTKLSKKQDPRIQQIEQQNNQKIEQHIKAVSAQAGCSSPEILQLYDYWHCCLFQCFNQCMDQWRPFGAIYTPYPWSSIIKIPHAPILSYLPDMLEMAKQKLLYFTTYEVGTIYDKSSCPKILKNLLPAQKQQHQEERLRQFLFDYVVQDSDNWVAHEIQNIQVIMGLGIEIENFLFRQMATQTYNIYVRKQL